jgi:hypothetical protein
VFGSTWLDSIQLATARTEEEFMLVPAPCVLLANMARLVLPPPQLRRVPAPCVLLANMARLVLPPPQLRRARVVVTGPFIKNLLRNHFITKKNLKTKSGDVNDEANFSLFFLLHKRAKPILPPYLPLGKGVRNEI